MLRGSLRTTSLLLIPQPPLSLLYLWAVRERLVSPAFTPLMLLAVLPLLALVACVFQSQHEDSGRARRVTILAIAVAELSWAVLSLAIVGFAKAWRIG
jgi:hypothetical protein